MEVKRQSVGALKSGDAVDDIFVLSEKHLAQKRDGSNYLNVAISDRTGTIRGVIWDDVEKIAAQVNSGDFVRVTASVSEYRNNPQLVIRSLTPVPADGIDAADFLPTTSQDIEQMFDRLLKVTETIESGHIRALLNAFWEDDRFVGDFKRAPAAKKMHHAYIGGLLEHCLSMAVLSDRIARHYSGVDRDLLMAGAILHDIGKVREFEYRVRIDYSDEGRLLGHIAIGLEMVDEKLRGIETFPRAQADLLKHMIISHHGALEFGSPEPPKTIEAVLLNYIDEIDSKVNGIREYMAAQDSGESWTPYHRLLQRHFYKGPLPETS